MGNVRPKKTREKCSGTCFFSFFFYQINCMTFFFMGFINDFQMGAVNHFMHCHLLTTSYTLVNIFQFWEPQICVSYHRELKQDSVCCLNIKFSLVYIQGITKPAVRRLVRRGGVKLSFHNHGFDAFSIISADCNHLISLA